MKKEYVQKPLAIICLAMPTIIFCIAILSLYFMPDKIAAHFDEKWNVTRYGNQYEWLFLGIVYYALPMLMTKLFLKVSSFIVQTIGLVASFFVSVCFLYIELQSMIKILKFAPSVILTAAKWVSFIISIVGCLIFIASHFVVLLDKGKLIKNYNTFDDREKRRYNIYLTLIVYLSGALIAIGSVLLKNYYSFAVIFGTLAISAGLLWLVLSNKKLIKKRLGKQYNPDF